MSDVPSWAEIVAEAVTAGLEETFTSLPGRVKSYDSTKKTATIELQVKRVIRKTDGGARHAPFPLLPSVPVGQPAGGGYFVHMPIAAGDFVWVMFSMRSLDAFRSKGTLTEVTDRRMHDLSFGWAMPVYDISAPPADSAAGLLLGKVGGPVVHVTEDGVSIGEVGADQAIPRGTRLAAKLQQILDVVQVWNGVINGSVVPEPGAGAASAFQAALKAAQTTATATLPTNLDNILSTKHTIEDA